MRALESVVVFMKKTISLLLAIVLAIGTLCSCQNRPVPAGSDNPTVGESQNASSVPEDGNLAKNCRVYYSSENQDANMYARYITDGDITTFWSSNTTSAVMDEYVTVDLDANIAIDSLVLHWGTSKALKYDVEFSRGGVEFTTVSSVSAADTSLLDETLTSEQFGEGAIARFIRVRCKEITAQFALYIGATIREIEVFGKKADDQTLGSETEAMVITKTVVPADGDVVAFGRHYQKNEMNWIGATYEFQCTGVAAGAVITAKTGKIQVKIDDGEYTSFDLAEGTHEYLFSDKLSDGTHTVRIMRACEVWDPVITVDGVIVAENGDLVRNYQPTYDMKIEFAGDSITSGSGVDYSDCYVVKTAEALNAEYNVISRGGEGMYRNRNYGANEGLYEDLYCRTVYEGEKDYTGGFDADAVVLNIGTNDSSYVGELSSDPTEQQEYVDNFDRLYGEMLDAIHKANPRAVILCVLGQMGGHSLLFESIQRNVESYRTRYPDSKIAYYRMKFGEDATEATTYHPGVASHKRDAEDVVEQLRKLMK